jgi:hypothetical protein
MRMPAELAREKSEKATGEIKDKEELSILKEATEIYDAARRSIDRASENGEFETMLCIGYECYHEDRNSKMKAAEIAKNRLICDGFNSRVSENTAIKEVLLCVDWR